MPRTSDDIRRTFIDFFRSKPRPGDGHTVVASSPVIPHEDPTLLFANAGMNQFKPIFLGQADPSSPLGKLRRAVNTQKCIRAGGKHNDLDDVGKDTYHHTFFEMLGNWSFGDYFKDEATAWSWELLTKVFGIPADRLYVTYFQGDMKAGLAPDEETRELWLRFLPPSRVLPGNMKDNFWEMGDTGPCGPCTEIHYDRIGAEARGHDAAKLVNTGDPDVIEIWNNVFIQFNREFAGGAPLGGLPLGGTPLGGTPLGGTALQSGAPGTLQSGASGTGLETGATKTRLIPLPAKHVDTGMGLERLVSVLQNVRSNYDTDLFYPIFAAIQRLTKARDYRGRLGAADEGNVDTAYRVIADHIRTLTFALTDGAVPSNEGRGYVLRRILRRAVRYGRQMLNAKTGFFAELVPVVVEKMSGAFPELKKKPSEVQRIIREEEESFGRTLDRGIALFDFAIGRQVAELLAEGKDLLVGGVRTVQPTDGAKHAETMIVLRETDRGGELQPIRLDQALRDIGLKRASVRISAADAFQLYDTYGFPIDLTVLMAEERGLKVDLPGYERLMAEAKDRSRGVAKAGGEAELILDADAIVRLKRMNVNPTDDLHKFHARDIRATVKAIWNGSNFDEATRADSEGLRPVGVVLDRTNFYAEMGGQVTDHGRINVTREPRGGGGPREDEAAGEFRVENVRAFGGYVLHAGLLSRGELRVGDSVQLHVEPARRHPIEANHTATHLLNYALRRVLGAHVEQKGSLVAPDRLRFDFTHPKPVAGPELAEAEAEVRSLIGRDLTVYADIGPLYVAKSINGLRAVFGEAYPDPVRAVSVGQPVPDLLADPGNPAWMELSVELCGGAHVQSTGQLGEFAVIAEEAVAKGVRRVAAVTGVAAKAAIQTADSLEARLSAASMLDGAALAAEAAGVATELDQLTMPVSRRDALRTKLTLLQERVKAAQKTASAQKRDAAVALARRIAEGAAASMDEMIVTTIDAGSDRAALDQAVRTVRDKCPRAAVMLVSADESDPESPKVSIAASVPEALVKRGLNAGEWVREAAAAVGGKGGGKPDAAQGGGTDVRKVKESLAAARAFAVRKLK